MKIAIIIMRALSYNEKRIGEFARSMSNTQGSNNNDATCRKVSEYVEALLVIDDIENASICKYRAETGDVLSQCKEIIMSQEAL